MQDQINRTQKIGKSARLIFRALQDGDENIFFSCIDDELLQHWIHLEKPQDLTEQKKRITTMLESMKTDGNMTLLAFQEKSMEFIGMCGIDTKSSRPDETEIEIWVKKEMQRNGYATEMVQFLIDWITKNTQLEELIYSVTTGNTGSEKIIKGLGGVELRRFYTNKRGKNREVIDYKIYL